MSTGRQQDRAYVEAVLPVGPRRVFTAWPACVAR
jgi:hypothetical protein